MSGFKLVAITGPDMCGKASQSRLLQQALTPSVGISFPEYADDQGNGHWAAEFVRAALRNEQIKLQRGSWTKVSSMQQWDDHGPYHTVTPTKANPYIFQMWQACDRLDRQQWINKTLQTHHIVADRYEVDALVYGLVDGCSLDFLLALDKLYRPADLAIALIGKGYPRPEEEPDLNERDTIFQGYIQEWYRRLPQLLPGRVDTIEIDSDDLVDADDPVQTVINIHRDICQKIEHHLGITVVPLHWQKIEEQFQHLRQTETTQ